jgi:S-adenosylmethionine:tRNA ribosyltransferase-isomerase
MRIDDFDFSLPENLIAQHPAPERDQARMMVVRRDSGRREHHYFRDLPDLLDHDHFLVLNNTRVFPARLRGTRPGKKEEIEILLVNETAERDWLALIKPGKKAPIGQKLIISELSAHVIEITPSGSRILRFDPGPDLRETFERIGEPPIPPYIHRRSDQAVTEEDRLRYQTVYARHSGSVAAPTAGLHFTESVFQRLASRNIPVFDLLLHVGIGTFQPVRCETIEEHTMHSEFFELSETTAAQIKACKSEGRRLVAVGTTTTRCLEFLAKQEHSWEGGASGYCNLFIYPGFRFGMLDGLITNFHLPRSTLFMLVCAFAGRDLMLDCYREAVAEGYRFFSYGDCMLIL